MHSTTEPMEYKRNATDDEFAATPGRLINEAARMFTRLYDARFRRIGLSASQVPVLAALKSGRSLPQAELVRIARIEQPSMAQLLVRMERDGLIRRRPDPNDKRSRLIALTKTAEKRLADASAILSETNEGAVLGFTPKEAALLLDLLQRLNGNLDRMASEAPT